MKSLQRQIALETQRALVAAEDDHFIDFSMKTFQKRPCLSDKLARRPEHSIAVSEADWCLGDSFDEVSSKAMISSRPRSSRHTEHENRSPNATAQVQAPFTLSFTQCVDSTSPAPGSQYGKASSAALSSTTMPQSVNVTFQVPGNQQIDFVETRTTADGAFVMKWAYRPAQVESQPRLLSSVADQGLPNGVWKASARKRVTKTEGDPVRSRKPATRSMVPKSGARGADKRPHEPREYSAQYNASSETPRERPSRSGLNGAAADEHENLSRQRAFHPNSAGDILRRKLSLRNLLTPPPSIADHSAPESPHRTPQEDVLSARYRNASDCMEKAITSLQRELLHEIKSSSEKLAFRDDLSSSNSKSCLPRRKPEIAFQNATSPARQPTPHPDLGKMLNNGRTSHAGRSHKQSQTMNRSLRRALSFPRDPWLDAAAPISPGKENRNLNCGDEK